MKRIKRTLAPDLTGLQDQYQELIDEYGEVGEDGKLITHLKENGKMTVDLTDPAAFKAKEDALLAQEATVRLRPIKLSELGDIDGKFNGIGLLLGALEDAGLLDMEQDE